MPLPLEGIRVLDAAAVVAAPFGAALLGDFGAEVIKIEMPGKGCTSRGMGPFHNGESLRWATFSRNKKTITLDLRKEKGRDLFLKMVEKSDVIFENFRTGTFDKWGLDYETLKKHNPGIIVVRITAYGQDGPNALMPGFGTPATAFSGLTYISGYPDRPPVNPPISLADYLAGVYGALAAMICLFYRDKTKGGGQEVDVSLYEGILRMLEGHIADFDKNGAIRERRPSISGSASPSGTFQTGDGKWVVLVCSTDKTFEYFAEGIGRKDLLADPRFCNNAARVKNNQAMEEIVTNWMRSHDWAYIKETLDKVGAPVSLVYSVEDIFNDPHYAARQNLVQVDHPRFGTLKMPCVVPKLSKTPGQIRWIGGDMGSFNDEIYSGMLDLSADEIGQLKTEGII